MELEEPQDRVDLTIGIHAGPSAFVPANFFFGAYDKSSFRARARYETLVEAVALFERGVTDAFFGDASNLTSDSSLNVLRLFEDSYVVVVKDTPGNRRRIQSVGDCTSKNWVLPEKGSRLRRVFDEFAGAAGHCCFECAFDAF